MQPQKNFVWLVVIICNFKGEAEAFEGGEAVQWAWLSPPLAPEELTGVHTLGQSGAAGPEASARRAARRRTSSKRWHLVIKENMSSARASLSPSLEVITRFLSTFYAFPTSFKGCVSLLGMIADFHYEEFSSRGVVCPLCKQTLDSRNRVIHHTDQDVRESHSGNRRLAPNSDSRCMRLSMSVVIPKQMPHAFLFLTSAFKAPSCFKKC